MPPRATPEEVSGDGGARRAGDPVPAVLRDDVGHALARVAQALGSHELLALHELGLDLRSYAVLALAAETALGQVEISDLTGVDRSTVVSVVDRLEQAGLVVRRPSTRDRRMRIVEPTDEGRRLARTAVDRVRALEATFMSPLEDAERDVFLAGVRRLAAGPLGRPADLSGLARTPRRRPGRGDPG